MNQIRGPPSEFETGKQISNSGGRICILNTHILLETNISQKVDGEFIEITKEVAYAMSNFYRSSKPRKIEVKNEKGKSLE